MARALLMEPFGGMAGDMWLAALLDLDQGAFALADLASLANALVPGECRLTLSETRRRSLRARHLDVQTPDSGAPVHRSLGDLLSLLEGGALSPAAAERAGRILRRIAEAEASLHGTTVDEVRFHEIGAVDTLVDVCGVVLGLERLGIERVLSTPPYVGGGSVHCAHGEMPVPAPATAALLRGWRLVFGAGGERVTPTAAAILAEVGEPLGEGRALALSATGYGAGQRDPAAGPPNLLRVSLAELGGSAGTTEDLRSAVAADNVLEVRCNLDDATGEELGFLLGELRRAGALEAWSSPLMMKKDRPGVLVSALCRARTRPALEALFFEHSPTLGLRWTQVERTECGREELRVQVEGVVVRVKRRLRPASGDASAPRAIDLSPEYEDLAQLARVTGRPLRELERLVLERLLA